MPSWITDNWHHSIADPLQDIAIMTAVNNWETTEDANKWIRANPRHLLDRVMSIKSDNHEPIIMYAKSGSRIAENFKLNVKIEDYNHQLNDNINDYFYSDEFMGKRRLNYIDNTQSIRFLIGKNGDSVEAASSIRLARFRALEMEHNFQEEYHYINIVENANYNNLYNIYESISFSSASFARSVSSLYKKPVTYHPAVSQVFSKGEAVASLLSARNNNGYSVAGMKSCDLIEQARNNIGRPRSILAGAEYSSVLWDL